VEANVWISIWVDEYPFMERTIKEPALAPENKSLSKL
jgi:hypothetical protein